MNSVLKKLSLVSRSLELDSGRMVWTPVSVKRLTFSAMEPGGNEVLLVHELAGMDEVVFRSH